jgi:hypothetical protein
MRDYRPQVRRQDKLRILAAIKRILPLLSAAAVTRRLWVVEEHAVRIRGETGGKPTRGCP